MRVGNYSLLGNLKRPHETSPYVVVFYLWREYYHNGLKLGIGIILNYPELRV